MPVCIRDHAEPRPHHDTCKSEDGERFEVPLSHITQSMHHFLADTALSQRTFSCCFLPKRRMSASS